MTKASENYNDKLKRGNTNTMRRVMDISNKMSTAF